jgi:rare lipoprotein A
LTQLRPGWFMTRKRLLIALMAICHVLILAEMRAEANWWNSSLGQVGYASWYGYRFHGRETASGERFSVQQLTAAHRHLPMGTKVLVTNLETDDLVEVKINDRGPMIKRRIIDLSRAAAETIGLLHRGVGQVRVVVSEEALELQDADDEAYFEVQVGAFADVEQAQDLLSQLQERYAAVHIASRDGPLGNYHRVRIGPFESRADAHDIMATLVQEGYYVFLDEVAASSFMDLHQHMGHKVPPGGFNGLAAERFESARFDPVHFGTAPPGDFEADRLEPSQFESARFAPVRLEVDRFEPVRLEVDGLNMDERHERVVRLFEAAR